MATWEIGATGRDYADPQEFYDDFVGTLSEQTIGEVYDDSPFTITSSQTTSGISTSSSNDLILRAASTKAFYDNITYGVDPLQYDTSYGVAFESSTAYMGAMFAIATVTNFTMQGLQIYVHATNCLAIQDTRGTTNNIAIYCKRLLIDGQQGSGFDQIITTSGGQNDNTDWAVINSLVICRGPASAHAIRLFGRGQLVGCDIVGTASSPTNDAVIGSYPSGKGGLVNCAVFGFDNPTNASALDITNCETDSSGYDATGTKTNAGTSKTYSSQFEDITGGHGAEDWTTKSGSDLEGAGADEALQENEDILGNTRTNGDFDIGCIQVQAAGGPFSGTPGTGSIAITGQTPTVQTPRVMQPGSASIALTGQTPTVQTPREMQPGTASVAISGQIPTVQTPREMSPGTASVSISGQIPSVDTGGGPFSGSPGTGAIAVVGFPPVVLTPREMSPGTAAVTLTGQTPTVQTPRVMLPGTASIAVTGQAPTTDIPFAATPGTAAVAITGQVPGLVLPRELQPGPGSIVLTGQVPVVNIPLAVAPGSGAIFILGFAPDVDDGAVWQVQPPSSDAWSLQAQTSTTWTLQPQSTDIWTDQ